MNVRNVDDLNVMLLVGCETEEWQRNALCQVISSSCLCCRLVVSGADFPVVESGVSIAEISVMAVVSRRKSVVTA